VKAYGGWNGGVVVGITQKRCRAWLGFLVLFWVLVREGGGTFSLSKFQPSLSPPPSLSLSFYFIL